MDTSAQAFLDAVTVTGVPEVLQLWQPAFGAAAGGTPSATCWRQVGWRFLGQLSQAMPSQALCGEAICAPSLPQRAAQFLHPVWCPRLRLKHVDKDPSELATTLPGAAVALPLRAPCGTLFVAYLQAEEQELLAHDRLVRLIRAAQAAGMQAVGCERAYASAPMIVNHAGLALSLVGRCGAVASRLADAFDLPITQIWAAVTVEPSKTLVLQSRGLPSCVREFGLWGLRAAREERILLVHPPAVQPPGEGQPGGRVALAFESQGLVWLASAGSAMCPTAEPSAGVEAMLTGAASLGALSLTIQDASHSLPPVVLDVMVRHISAVGELLNEARAACAAVGLRLLAPRCALPLATAAALVSSTDATFDVERADAYFAGGPLSRACCCSAPSTSAAVMVYQRIGTPPHAQRKPRLARNDAPPQHQMAPSDVPPAPPPRRRRTAVKMRGLTMERLRGQFGQSLAQAAAALGVSETLLKNACRTLGIKRWPFRKVSAQRRGAARGVRLAASDAGSDDISDQDPRPARARASAVRPPRPRRSAEQAAMSYHASPLLADDADDARINTLALLASGDAAHYAASDGVGGGTRGVENAEPMRLFSPPMAISPALLLGCGADDQKALLSPQFQALSFSHGVKPPAS